MRTGAFLGLILGIGWAALCQPCPCEPEQYNILGLSRESRTVGITLSTPLEEILRGISGGGSVNLSFSTTELSSGWRATCNYPECCPAYIHVTIVSVLTLSFSLSDPYNPWWQERVGGALLPSSEERAEWVDTTGEKPVCHSKHVVTGRTFSTTLTLGVRIGLGPISVGYSLSSYEAQVMSSVAAKCCAEGVRERCGSNEPPALSAPHYFSVPLGGTHELVLLASDKNGARDIVDVRLPKLPQGVEVLSRKKKGRLIPPSA